MCYRCDRRKRQGARKSLSRRRARPGGVVGAGVGTAERKREGRACLDEARADPAGRDMGRLMPWRSSAGVDWWRSCWWVIAWGIWGREVKRGWQWEAHAAIVTAAHRVLVCEA